MKISYIIFLFIISCSYHSSGQESIKYKLIDRNEQHISILNLCGTEAKKEYIRISKKKKNDSIKIYLEGFKQNTEFYFDTGIKKYFKTIIINNSLSHLMYCEYVTICRDELSASSSLTIKIKYFLPKYPEYSFFYELKIDNFNNKILNSNSLVIKIDNYPDGVNYFTIGYSSVDEVIYQKILKKCAKKILGNKFVR